MPVLLVQSCSASKQQCSSPIPALELYTGYFYKIINKSRREGALRDDVVLRILSAEHGILRPDTEVEQYDRQMTSDRAAALRESVVESLATTVREHSIDMVVINAGTEYRSALTGLRDVLDDSVDIRYISGGGIGEMGRQLKSFIRTDEQTELSA